MLDELISELATKLRRRWLILSRISGSFGIDVWDELKFFNIHEVPKTPNLTFVFNEVRLRDEWDSKPRNPGLDTISPDLLERHRTDGREDVDVVFVATETKIALIIQ